MTMTEIAAFTNRPECRACGDQSFKWRYLPEMVDASRFGEGTRFLPASTDVPHLLLTCSRCGWQFSMKVKDEEGA